MKNFRKWHQMEVEKLKEFMNEKKTDKDSIAVQEAVTLIADAAVRLSSVVKVCRREVHLLSDYRERRKRYEFSTSCHLQTSRGERSYDIYSRSRRELFSLGKR